MAAAYYPYDDPTLDPGEREYLKILAGFAAEQNLGEDLRGYVRDISIAFTVFAAFVVGLRFTARHIQGARFLIDDYLMVAALAMLTGTMSINLVLVNHGIGLHSGRLDLQSIQYLTRTMIGVEILYVNGVNMYKIALLFLYLRVFPTTEVRRGAWICGSLSLLWTLVCIIAASLQCVPLNALWEPWKPGKCINLFITQMSISIPSIIIDIGILYLPIPHVLRLQMTKTQRCLVLITFMLGSYVVFTSIYRFRIYLMLNEDDMPYSVARGLAWNVIEISSGIVSACLPTLGPIVRMVFRGLTAIAHGIGLGKYMPSTEKKSSGFSRSVTIGGGGGLSRANSLGRAGTNIKDWSKISEGLGNNSSVSHNQSLREDAKYGIDLKTIGSSGGGGGDDDDMEGGRSSRSSRDMEATRAQSVASVSVKSPGRARSFTDNEQRLTAREHYHGSRLSRSKSRRRKEYPAPDNVIWQHREVEITTEPVEPESVLPEPNRKRTSGPL